MQQHSIPAQCKHITNITTSIINLKGAAAQLPSPVPAPRSPAWQLAAERRTTACKLIRLDLIELRVIKRRANACQGDDGSVFDEKLLKHEGIAKYFEKSRQASKKVTISAICQQAASLMIKLIKKANIL